MIDIPAPLHRLNDLFNENGYEIRIVGGAVRDHLMGIEPKDIDLATDATPDEQIMVYRKNDISYHETGLQHGTLTVVLDGEPYEVTTLRIDTNTDGRHAEVEYTRDWKQDALRRDLTINSMSMDFQGVLSDPFGGYQDVIDKRVRFVGNAEDRIKEDYLRILRWVRFFQRISCRHGFVQPDKETTDAISKNAFGLDCISRERIWSEMRLIIKGNEAYEVMKMMESLEMLPYIGLPPMNIFAPVHKDMEPVTAMVAMFDMGARDLWRDWKWSTDERKLLEVLIRNISTPLDRDDLIRMVAVDGMDRNHANQLALLWGVGDFNLTDIPSFPVRGQDLIDLGYPRGKEIGDMLARLKEEWKESGYKMSRDDLINELTF